MERNFNDIIAEDFQLSVDFSLKRNKNLLDTITKYQLASSRLSRAITKASTQCGCIRLVGSTPEKSDFPTLQLEGTLCKNCRAVIEQEIGDSLFYITAICNALDFSIYDILLKEKESLHTLGKFSLK